MKRQTLLGLCAAVGIGLGCGGGGAANGGAAPAAAPANPAPGALGPDASAASAAPTPAQVTPTSTTTSLGDGGSAGAKLVPETTPTASGGAPPVPKGHTHDAGRGTDDLRAIITAHRDEARACYDSALKDHPGLEGDMVITWTIDPKGAVSQIALDSGRSKITEPSVAGCIIGIIQKIQFAASPGGFETKTSYPFNFHPHHVKQP